MSSIKVILKNHPVLSYYILTFLISYSALLLLIVARGLPPTRVAMDAMMPVTIGGMLLGPSVSGLLMTGVVGGRAGFHELGERLRKWRVGLGWYILVLFLPAGIYFSVLAALSLFSPVYLPGIFTVDDKTSRLIMNVSAAVAVGICEELGWTGFVTPRLRQRYSSLVTGLIIGALWGAWHILPMAIWCSLVYGPPLSPAVYAAVRSLNFLIGGLVAFRVVMVWVHDNTRSLLLVILFHISQTAGSMLADPEAITGVSNFVGDYVGAAVTWLVAGIVYVAQGRRVSAKPRPSMAL